MLHRGFGLGAFDDVLQVQAPVALHDDTGKKIAESGLAHADLQRLFRLHLQIQPAHGQRFPAQQIVAQAEARCGSAIGGGVGKHGRHSACCAAWCSVFCVNQMYGAGQCRAHAQVVQSGIALHMQLHALGQGGVLQLALEVAIGTQQIDVEQVTKIGLKSVQRQAQGLHLALGGHGLQTELATKAEAARLHAPAGAQLGRKLQRRGCSVVRHGLQLAQPHAQRAQLQRHGGGIAGSARGRCGFIAELKLAAVNVQSLQHQFPGWRGGCVCRGPGLGGRGGAGVGGQPCLIHPVSLCIAQHAGLGFVQAQLLHLYGLAGQVDAGIFELQGLHLYRCLGIFELQVLYGQLANLCGHGCAIPCQTGVSVQLRGELGFEVRGQVGRGPLQRQVLQAHSQLALLWRQAAIGAQ